MYNKHAFEAGNKGGCGPMGRGGFGGQWAGPTFGRGKFGGFFGRHAGGFHQKPPVNIEETDAEFTISLYSAGLIKENVTLSVKDDVLTILYQVSDQPTDDQQAATGNYTYQEYSNRSFERSFKLNDKVLTESITASYADGILKVTLPKNPATNKPAQTITVS